MFLGPVTVTMKTDEDLGAGMVLVSGEMVKPAETAKPSLVLPDGRKIELCALFLFEQVKGPAHTAQHAEAEDIHLEQS